MTYKAKVAVCYEIVIKHSMQSEHLVPWWYVKKPLGFERLRF